MNLLWVELPFLVALAVHIAICAVLVTVIGAFVLWLCRSASAPLRHTLALSFLVATLLVPGIASLCHWRIGLPITLAATKATSITQSSTQVTGAGPTPLDEPATYGSAISQTISWSFLVSGALVVVWITGSVVFTLQTLLAFGRQRRYLA